ncbi:hypothetical protein HYC85_018567 [Camellia sinensis]|uniref:Uncharacterized protein n=1 Tax=Camellia sinensis TaxID=4442 RepID=A0A7J7GUZ0_CAMSI|nr:hypothetical protein HYC85_018567 [Camellia sinensis]
MSPNQYYAYNTVMYYTNITTTKATRPQHIHPTPSPCLTITERAMIILTNITQQSLLFPYTPNQVTKQYICYIKHMTTTPIPQPTKHKKIKKNPPTPQKPPTTITV